MLTIKAVGEWLGHDFDRDAEMIDLIESGCFSDAPVARYLLSLRGHFEGPIVADLLCYLCEPTPNSPCAPMAC